MMVLFLERQVEAGLATKRTPLTRLGGMNCTWLYPAISGTSEHFVFFFSRKLGTYRVVQKGRREVVVDS